MRSNVAIAEPRKARPPLVGGNALITDNENLVSNEARNNLIIEDVKNAVSEGRTPLILSDRIEHLKTLQKQLADCAKNVILITGRGTQKQKKELIEKLNSVPTGDRADNSCDWKICGGRF